MSHRLKTSCFLFSCLRKMGKKFWSFPIHACNYDKNCKRIIIFLRFPILCWLNPVVNAIMIWICMPFLEIFFSFWYLVLMLENCSHWIKHWYIHVPVFLKNFLKQMHLIYGTNQELLLYACDYLYTYQEILLQIIRTSCTLTDYSKCWNY